MFTVRAGNEGGALRLAGLGLTLFVFTLAGCAESAPEGYDPAMRYPARTDRLVLALPPADPNDWETAGKMDEAIAGLDVLGGKTVDPKSLPPDGRKQLEAALEAIFGTPAAPTVTLPDRPAEIGGLDLTPAHLADGGRVYRRLCNQCHGLSGDGRGPTGPFVFPHPRDLRQGVYKVAAAGGKPTSETLVRIIRGGVPGTSMQPFDLIPDADVRAVSAYTIYLSLRGEVEFRVLKTMADDDIEDVAVACASNLRTVFDQWTMAQTVATPAVPSSSNLTDSIRNGHRLFTSEALGCVKCHRDYGRQDTFKYTVWGTPARVPDLTQGVFRWGKRPDEIAARIRNGISTVGMPSHPTLTDGEVADLVNFVRELGYPQRLPADVREKDYPAGVAP